MVQAPALHRILLLVLVAGLAVSSYAAFEVLQPALQGVCTVNAFFSCSAVDRSGLTSIGPVPDWLIGVGGFAAMLLLDVLLVRSYSARLLQAITLLALAGLAVSGYLAYVELGLIHALCPVCVAAYAADAGALAVCLMLWRLRRTAGAEPERNSIRPAA
ncbi:MAG TPA: vitamin K epoxide reductase family protein [Thermoplasmata archaeon]|nr:vitamin K epoxide reductase family protein [Thermoplasmata archaeon]